MGRWLAGVDEWLSAGRGRATGIPPVSYPLTRIFPQAMIPDSTLAAARIAQLRVAMQHHKLDAWIVPSADPHLSEYLPEHWQGRQWLSGFTGSAGTLVVTADWAGLWTDSRYWSQAEAELAGSGIAMMKMPPGVAQPHVVWLAENLRSQQIVGIDGAVLSLFAARQMELALTGQGILRRTDIDLLAEVWNNRPPLPGAPVYEHPAPYASVPRRDKLAAMRAEMRGHGADWHLLSALDDIAWLFNLRGSDVNFNPFFIAHALIGPQRATLFVTAGKIPVALREALATDGVDIAPYEQAASALVALRPEAVLLLDPRRVALRLWQAKPETVRMVEAANPAIMAKSRKTEADIAHIRAAMEQDGAALCDFFAWLEQALADPAQTVTELTVDERVTAARAHRHGFVSPSFDTIAGFNANGAMPHYRATKAVHATIAGHGLLLLDSGGQYLGGTTDITRVAPVGEPSPEQKRDFTLVLKGLIALSSAHFPSGIRASMLDGIARAPLWAEGIDYGHGTGHGVGYFLGVHEGPQSISFHAQAEPQTAMENGMITSIEPSLYRDGKWGIRIENLVLNRPAETNDFGAFMRFETLTLCPIDSRCIDPSLLRLDEIAWLNGYHAIVRERLLPLVQGAARAWLLTRTEPI